MKLCRALAYIQFSKSPKRPELLAASIPNPKETNSETEPYHLRGEVKVTPDFGISFQRSGLKKKLPSLPSGH
jgi:hypothetical protein